MDKDGYIKLADFGLSKIVSEKNNQIKMKKDKKDTEEYLCGTLEYLSPDVILKRQYEFHTDLWSFGVLMFEMLTGLVRFSISHFHSPLSLTEIGRNSFIKLSINRSALIQYLTRTAWIS